MNYIAEGLAAAALLINFIGYRQNDVNRYRLVSALALLCLSLHFFMINALAAGVSCALSVLRNLIAMRTQHVSVVYVFVAATLGFFAYEWFVLDNGPLIIVAYTSFIIFTIGSVVLTTTQAIRRWFLFAELLGLAYAIGVGSVFGSLFNITNLVSITIKAREDKRRLARSQA